VRIIGRARERGLEFSVQDLFEHQTVGGVGSGNAARGVDKEKGTAAFDWWEKKCEAGWRKMWRMRIR